MEATTKAGRKQARRPRFARYVRVSDVGDRGDSLRSPEYQRSVTDRFADVEGIVLAEYPDELDVSGSSRTRVVLDRILDDLAAGRVDGIVVAKLDRLSRLKPRDRVELFSLVEEELGGRILSATESNDVSSPQGRFVRELFLSLARMEWENAAQGFETAKASAIAAGVAIMVKAPYGFRFDDDHRLVAGPADERELLGELFELRLAGESYGTILELFERRTGRKSSRATMSGMLANEAYVGVLEHGDHRNESAHPGIVDRGLFNAVQAKAELSRADWKAGRRSSGRARAMLSGIATCEACGSRLVSTEAGGYGKRYYRCPNDARHCQARASISELALDCHVEELLLEWAGPVADVEVEVEDVAADRDATEARLALAERRLAEWAADVELEEADEDAYRAGLKARQEHVARRRQDVAELGAASELELARTTLREAWSFLGNDERRRLLRVVVLDLVVRKTPRFNAPASERSVLTFAGPGSSGSAPASSEDGAELLEQSA